MFFSYFYGKRIYRAKRYHLESELLYMDISPIFDNHGRPIQYLRISVTDRCNLRCFYCMPQEGIDYLPKKELLTYEEILKLVRILAGMGVKKVRITGGEPFMRKDLMPFLWKIAETEGIEELHLTTNGVLTVPHIAELKAMGIRSVNLSLDTLDRDRFKKITFRDDFQKVIQTFDLLLANDIALKINAVVMANQNTEDIIPLAELGKLHPVTVRFIEEMPFNGVGQREYTEFWNYKKILATLENHYPEIYKIEDEPFATATNYAIPGHLGKIGIIAAFSRTFCGTCNRIRVTAQGILKTCLYDNGVLDLKKLLRSGLSEEDLRKELYQAFQSREKDGFEAEKNRTPISESMSVIGG